jgi:hypothetical protein
MMLLQLHLASLRATKDTLHLCCQIVGDIELASTALRYGLPGCLDAGVSECRGPAALAAPAGWC